MDKQKILEFFPSVEQEPGLFFLVLVGVIIAGGAIRVLIDSFTKKKKDEQLVQKQTSEALPEQDDELLVKKQASYNQDFIHVEASSSSFIGPLKEGTVKRDKKVETSAAPFIANPLKEYFFKQDNKQGRNMNNLYLSNEDNKLAQLLEKKASGGLTEEEQEDFNEFMKIKCKELYGWSDELLEKVYGFSKKKKLDKVVLDGETLTRYVRSTCLINDLTYLNLGHNIKLGNGEFPDNKNRWHQTGAVIVPSIEITNFYDYHGADYRWWVLTSDDSNIIEKELLYIVLDFDLPRSDRALSFFLVHKHDANWACFLEKSDSLVILSGPSKTISNALIVPMENDFRSHVNLWLSKFT